VEAEIMYAKNAEILVGVGRGRSTSSAFFVPPGIYRFVGQVLFLAPLFWFMELLQNQAYRLVTSQFGWFYRLAPPNQHTTWYSVRSLPCWLLTVSVFSMLDERFERKQLSRLTRFLIAGTLGWAGEWMIGFIAAHVSQRGLQIWPGSPLVYIAFSALPIWWIDFVIFQWLTRELRHAQAHRSSFPISSSLRTRL
jgi:hypothetical protein